MLPRDRGTAGGRSLAQARAAALSDWSLQSALQAVLANA